MPRSRIEGDLARGRRAAAAARSEGRTALEAAHAYIEAAFAPAMRHSQLKDRVAATIISGANHPEVRARYGSLVERYPGLKIHGAIALVEWLRRAEHEARSAAIRTWGHTSRPRLPLMILDEIWLILRVMRRHAPEHYDECIGCLLEMEMSGGESAEAAE